MLIILFSTIAARTTRATSDPFEEEDESVNWLKLGKGGCVQRVKIILA
jgi:hypothetical protein